MGMDRPMGSIPSHTAKTISKIRASQKAGVLLMTRQYPRMILSGSFPRLAPATIPKNSPKMPDMIQAKIISHNEFASRSPNT